MKPTAFPLAQVMIFPLVLIGLLFPLTIPARAVADEAPEAITSLDHLIQEALQKSPGIQAKQRAYEAARARVLAAWLPDDPEIGVDVEGQSDPLRLDRADNEYSVMQTVPFPTKLLLRGQIALREAQMAFQAYKATERDVVWHIEQPYYELSLARKTVASLEGIRSLIERLARSAQARYEANQTSQQDVLAAQIELAKVGIDLVDWREKAHIAEAHLSHLLNQSLETRYEPAEPPRSQPLTRARTELEQLALRMRPELLASAIGIRRAKAGRALALTEWLPDFTGRIEARQFKGSDSIGEYDTFLGLTVPVWSLIKGAGGQWKGAAKEVQAAEALYDEMKNEVLLAIHEAYSKVTSAEYAVQAYEQLILPKARQRVDVTLASYEAGRTDFITLIDAQRTLRDTQIAYDTVRTQRDLGLSDLRLAVGGDVSLDSPSSEFRVESSEFQLSTSNSELRTPKVQR